MSETELIFLGTGTSSSVPYIHCLTNPPDGKRCRTCLSTLKPEGKKNIRRNTSAVVRAKEKDGRTITIVIDAGKNFQAAAIEWFPKYGLRTIDALLITHAHADAMNGLDDLRGWTLGGHVQSHIDVYVSLATFNEVQRSFPYLVSKEYASGGGDVPEFKWNIIDDQVPFEIMDTGIMVTPFAVHHGRVFSSASFIPTPAPSKPTTPALKELSVVDKTEVIQPYLCFGFKIGNEIVYLSDVNFIPEPVWPILTSIPICVLDCLHLRKHSSHFSLEEALAATRRIGAQRTYLTGFSHEISHEEYVTITEVAGGRPRPAQEELSKQEKLGVALIKDGDEPVWVRPAHDGLRCLVREGVASDET